MKAYRKSGRGAVAIPMPGPRPRRGHLPPPRTTKVPPRTAGSSPVQLGSGEGPLLAGMSVIVFPGRSSRSLAGSAAVVGGVIISAGLAAISSVRPDSADAGGGDAGRRGERAGRTVWCAGRCRSSTGEAISISGAGERRVISRSRIVAVTCSLLSDPQPSIAVARAVRERRARVRMHPPVARCLIPSS